MTGNFPSQIKHPWLPLTASFGVVHPSHIYQQYRSAVVYGELQSALAAAEDSVRRELCVEGIEREIVGVHSAIEGRAVSVRDELVNESCQMKYRKLASMEIQSPESSSTDEEWMQLSVAFSRLIVKQHNREYHSRCPCVIRDIGQSSEKLGARPVNAADCLVHVLTGNSIEPACAFSLREPIEANIINVPCAPQQHLQHPSSAVTMAAALPPPRLEASLDTAINEHFGWCESFAEPPEAPGAKC
ncbi:hypothetical protein FIBSPDRAFT_884872 [Athelia psychrophila]|uniref:Uncharacterized protein n=1 Tax=Athelia psychrophila TaxID=1759441 RepID=A0A166SH16_9AGAM|nr:hypothetical protein FIBSPDRAFT_884872 [Fibularhizoctonia sp. CBS 109695]